MQKNFDGLHRAPISVHIITPQISCLSQKVALQRNTRLSLHAASPDFSCQPPSIVGNMDGMVWIPHTTPLQNIRNYPFNAHCFGKTCSAITYCIFKCPYTFGHVVYLSVEFWILILDFLIWDLNINELH